MNKEEKDKMKNWLFWIFYEPIYILTRIYFEKIKIFFRMKFIKERVQRLAEFIPLLTKEQRYLYWGEEYTSFYNPLEIGGIGFYKDELPKANELLQKIDKDVYIVYSDPYNKYYDSSVTEISRLSFNRDAQQWGYGEYLDICYEIKWYFAHISNSIRFFKFLFKKYILKITEDDES